MSKKLPVKCGGSMQYTHTTSFGEKKYKCVKCSTESLFVTDECRALFHIWGTKKKRVSMAALFPGEYVKLREPHLKNRRKVMIKDLPLRRVPEAIEDLLKEDFLDIVKLELLQEKLEEIRYK